MNHAPRSTNATVPSVILVITMLAAEAIVERLYNALA
jgi:hypothetical protein